MPRRDLAEYRRKRNFGSTPEPAGADGTNVSGPLTFVVHKHAARRLHYDLRIECDGVLLSFAIPRGPSATIGDRRLAVRTEDHPLDYASFEGVIPRGQYGAGSSIIWDAGTYSPDEPTTRFEDREAAEDAVREGLDVGKLSLTFRGRKLKGSWALVRTAENWLLLKHRDAAADPSIELTALDRSILGGHTNAEVARLAPPPNHRFVHFAPQSVDGSKPAPTRAQSPMLATAQKAIPADGWTYEPKLDGIRMVAVLVDGEARLVSRGGNDITRAYPGLARAVQQLPAERLVLDGEIVAPDATGRPSFGRLQERMNLVDSGDITRAESATPVVYYAFDVLHLDGFDLVRAGLEDRREVLARLIVPGGVIREVPTIGLPPQQAFDVAVELGFEGLIAKRAGSRYEPGRRSDNWRKWKAARRAVFTVGGFTRGEGSRASTFGGLVLGQWDTGGLAYRGRVGSGFSDAQAVELREQLDARIRESSPFYQPVPDSRRITWVEPGLDVNVEYAEQSAAGILRAPVFRGLADSQSPAAPAPGSRQDDQLLALLDQLSGDQRSRTLEGDGWTIRLTNLDKVLWPAAGSRRPITKRHLLRHAIASWPALQPILQDRLVTVTRYPDGIDGNSFYQRHLDARRPSFAETVSVFSETDGKDKPYILCNNLPTLLYLCQQAALEWHMSLARVTPPVDGEEGSTTFRGSAEAVDDSVLNHPDILLFDLDSYVYRGDERAGEEPQPSERGFEAAKEAAEAVHIVLGELGLPAFLKTSGKTGLHVCVPIRRNLDFAAVRAFATTLGAELVRRHPRLLTTEWQSKKRTGKVFVDVNQNGRARAIAAPYSPRAHPGAPVSMPVEWSRLPGTLLGANTIEDEPTFADAGPWASFADSAVDLRAFLGMA